jgi:ubiquinone/menaquinone biosynthesis C-methylase UbiE
MLSSGSSNNKNTTNSLIENVIKQQTMLLADVKHFDLEEDDSIYFSMMLEALAPKMILDIFTCALLERKILLISKSYTLLTATASSITQLLQPLGWSHVLIPILPRSMLGTLECPTPFIMGIHSSYAYKKDFPFVLDLCVVNLDQGTITMQQANAEMLDQHDEPDELYAAVTEAIRAPASKEGVLLVQNIAKAMKPMSSLSDSVTWPPLSDKERKELNPTKRIRTLFRNHVMSLLEGAEYCCIPLSDGNKEAIVLFDRVPYMARHSEDSHPLLNALVQTGCFSRYLTDKAKRGITITTMDSKQDQSVEPTHGGAKYNVVYNQSTPEIYNEWAKDGYDETVAQNSYACNSLCQKFMEQVKNYDCSNGPIQILDAACGTGRVCEVVVEKVAPLQVLFDGVDYSQGMLDVAKSKNIYRNLLIANLQEKIDLPSKTYDFILCSGVFLQGHVGPEALPELSRLLKSGGFMIFTVRPTFYDETKELWNDTIKDSACDLLEISMMEYSKGFNAPILTCRKK